MKFQKGEIAILAHVRPSPFSFDAGIEVVIVAVERGITDEGDPHDYGISNEAGEVRWVAEWQLRKRYPPGSDIARNIMAKLPKTDKEYA